MREKLNENPMVQVALLGVLALIVGFLVMTRMGGGSDETTTPAATTATPDATATDATATPEATATPDATATTPATPAPDTGAVPPPAPTSDFKAGPGLPEDVVAAYDANKVVVLLIVNNGSVDDDKVKAIAEDLRGRSDTALFVIATGDASEYSRITQGVDLRQTPALVVLQPKKLVDGPQPTATIEYGFRGPESVTQAVEDALYNGPDDLPYYPN